MYKQFKRHIKSLIERNGTETYLYYKTEGKCPGAFNELGEYDYLLDLAYHKANPTASPCNKGEFRKEGVFVVEKAIYKDTLYKDDEILSTMGVVEQGDAYLIYNTDIDLHSVDYLAVMGQRYKIKGVKEKIGGGLVLYRVAILTESDGS